MILPDHELERWALRGGVTPYNPAHVNPASIDLCISTTHVIELNDWRHVYYDPDEGLTIIPGYAVLVSTIEYMRMPHDCAGVVFLKSSLARRGLDHALAGFVDPGFKGELTLELHAHRSITLKHGERIIQLTLHRLGSPSIETYHGKYQNQQGPQEAI